MYHYHKDKSGHCTCTGICTIYNSFSPQRIGIVNKYIGHNFKFKEILLLNSADRLKFVRQITSNHHFSVQLHVQKTSKVKNPDSVFGVSLMCTVYHFWFSVDHWWQVITVFEVCDNFYPLTIHWETSPCKTKCSQF